MTSGVVVPDDCQACGACCFGTTRHVRVDGDDHARLGEDAEDLVVWIGARAFLRLEPPRDDASFDGIARCAQLLGTSSGGFACAIYDRRPTPCRELERGSPACLAVLAARSRP